MPKFRKKPVEIEARQIEADGETITAVARWCGGAESFTTAPDGRVIEASISLTTLEAQDHRARLGDWVIQGVRGEFYSCKPDIFEATYEPTAGHEQDNDGSTR